MMKLLVVFVIVLAPLCLGKAVCAQAFDTDRELLAVVEPAPSMASLSGHERHGIILQRLPEKQRFNPLFLLAQGAFTVYQQGISPQLASNCMFEQSCSRFGRQAIDELGVVHGTVLALDRWSRCHRITHEETSPLRLNRDGKIKDSPSFYQKLKARHP